MPITQIRQAYYKEQECKVILCNTPIFGPVIKRWIVIFVWKSGYTITAEAKNKNGILIPILIPKLISNIDDWRIVKFIIVSSLSPTDVYNFATFDIEINGKLYDPPYHKEKKWAIKLFSKIAWKHEESINNSPGNCELYLYRRKICGKLAYHWVISFMWDNGYEATYEANNVGDILVPRWRRGGPEYSRQGEEEKPFSWTCQHVYRNLFCSPSDVNNMAYNIGINWKKYWLSHKNCQTWAKKLAQMFGINLPINDAIANHRKCHKFVAC
ncbi:unnamed protein product [Meganyctiphanes norvegica]|uniref:Uncharacterized protein n=1 Tax=Meganyctiphanes norvegica TaxID=48144 RepID=A0AAV2S0T8_MEGNR